jgi:hypothetical protein
LRDPLRLLLSVARAVSTVIVTVFAVVLICVQAGTPEGVADAIFAVCLFLAFFLAVWWMRRKLKRWYPNRHARAVSIAFGLATPFSMAAGLVLAELPAGYLAALLGKNIFGFVGSVACAIAITTLLSFLVCLCTLRISRRAARLEEIGPS